jgi:hypothetical protein
VNFLFNTLLSGNAAIFGFLNPNASIGHELTACGLTWDPLSELGTIFFVDPLDPSFAGGLVGPAQITTGQLSYLSGIFNGVSYSNALSISYTQYQGNLPYNREYDPAEGLIIAANVISVPEPSTYALFGIGAIGLVIVLRRNAEKLKG